ncbi:MAG: RluA family pseudouridine synthase [Oscillospiraceae bacterium]
MQLEFTVENHEAGIKLAAFLRRRRLSLGLVRSLKRQPMGLCVNGNRAKTTNQCLAAGDAVLLTLPLDTGLSAMPQNGPVHILYKSQHALVVDKPPGMPMHPSPSHHAGTLANFYSGLMQRTQGAGLFRPVGRLDTDTSGLVLCAGHVAAVPLLAASLQKTYLALVHGALVPEKGSFTGPLAAAPGSATRQQVHPAGRPSHTDYRVLAVGQGATLVAVFPRTGRTHQVRAHFAHAGHPLLGDALYGGPRDKMGRHALHCARLVFTELDGQRRAISLAAPEDMRYAAAACGIELSAAHPEGPIAPAVEMQVPDIV